MPVQGTGAAARCTVRQRMSFELHWETCTRQTRLRRYATKKLAMGVGYNVRLLQGLILYIPASVTRIRVSACSSDRAPIGANHNCFISVTDNVDVTRSRPDYAQAMKSSIRTKFLGLKTVKDEHSIYVRLPCRPEVHHQPAQVVRPKSGPFLWEATGCPRMQATVKMKRSRSFRSVSAISEHKPRGPR